MTPGEVWILFAVIIGIGIWSAATPNADDSEYSEWWR